MKVKRISDFKYHRLDDKLLYNLVLDAPLRIYFGDKDWGFHDLVDDKGKVWVKLRGHIWEIQKDYAWDGSSPKVKVCKQWLGTPDLLSTLVASCWHDSSGQFRHLKCVNKSLSWGEWNKYFRDLITDNLIGWVYYLGLMAGNVPYQFLGKWAGKKATGSCNFHKTI